jgi:hypothetical protein
MVVNFLAIFPTANQAGVALGWAFKSISRSPALPLVLALTPINAARRHALLVCVCMDDFRIDPPLVSRTRRSPGDLLRSPTHATSLPPPCMSVDRQHGGRCITGSARCAARTKLLRGLVPYASCSNSRICWCLPSSPLHLKARLNIDLRYSFRLSIIRSSFQAESRAGRS